MCIELLNNLIYPIIYTTIGAGIGGWVAYKLAKQQYSRDRLNKTIGVIFLLQKNANRIAKRSKEMSENIYEFYAKSSVNSTSFLYDVFKMHLNTNIDLLQLIHQWEMCKEDVSLCGSKLICKDSKTRKKIETLEDIFSSTSFKIQSYRRTYESFKKKYDVESQKEGFDIHSFLNSEESKSEFENAAKYLAKISNLCKEISEIYKKLERYMSV